MIKADRCGCLMESIMHARGQPYLIMQIGSGMHVRRCRPAMLISIIDRVSNLALLWFLFVQSD
jgi:hypothetical protein